jgi:hypothetical protein
MSLFFGAVFGNSEWQEKEDDFRESNAESEKH